MKRITSVLALLPSVALAHPGDHGPAGVVANLRHVLTEADHLALLAVMVAVAAALIWWRKGERGSGERGRGRAE